MTTKNTEGDESITDGMILTSKEDLLVTISWLLLACDPPVEQVPMPSEVRRVIGLVDEANKIAAELIATGGNGAPNRSGQFQ